MVKVNEFGVLKANALLIYEHIGCVERKSSAGTVHDQFRRSAVLLKMTSLVRIYAS